MRARERVRSPARREPFIDPKPLILIVCEGRRTEPEYLDAFWRHCQNPRVRIEIPSEHGVPLTLVRHAKRLKSEAARSAKFRNDENLAYDSVWCVHDVDDHPHLHEARELANANGIELAASNPSFELWLLLHFRDSPGMQHRDEILSLLKRHDEDYDKGIRFRLYSQSYEVAERRAKQLDNLAEQCQSPGCNPTTRVYKLTQLIRGGKFD